MTICFLSIAYLIFVNILIEKTTALVTFHLVRTIYIIHMKTIYRRLPVSFGPSEESVTEALLDCGGFGVEGP